MSAERGVLLERNLELSNTPASNERERPRKADVAWEVPPAQREESGSSNPSPPLSDDDMQLPALDLNDPMTSFWDGDDVHPAINFAKSSDPDGAWLRSSHSDASVALKDVANATRLHSLAAVGADEPLRAQQPRAAKTSAKRATKKAVKTKVSTAPRAPPSHSAAAGSSPSRLLQKLRAANFYSPALGLPHIGKRAAASAATESADSKAASGDRQQPSFGPASPTNGPAEAIRCVMDDSFVGMSCFGSPLPLAIHSPVGGTLECANCYAAFESHMAPATPPNQLFGSPVNVSAGSARSADCSPAFLSPTPSGARDQADGGSNVFCAFQSFLCARQYNTPLPGGRRSPELFQGSDPVDSVPDLQPPQGEAPMGTPISFGSMQPPTLDLALPQPLCDSGAPTPVLAPGFAPSWADDHFSFETCADAQASTPVPVGAQRQAARDGTTLPFLSPALPIPNTALAAGAQATPTSISLSASVDLSRCNPFAQVKWIMHQRSEAVASVQHARQIIGQLKQDVHETVTEATGSRPADGGNQAAAERVGEVAVAEPPGTPPYFKLMRHLNRGGTQPEADAGTQQLPLMLSPQYTGHAQEPVVAAAEPTRRPAPAITQRQQEHADAIAQAAREQAAAPQAAESDGDDVDEAGGSADQGNAFGMLLHEIANNHYCSPAIGHDFFRRCQYGPGAGEPPEGTHALSPTEEEAVPDSPFSSNVPGSQRSDTRVRAFSCRLAGSESGSEAPCIDGDLDAMDSPDLSWLPTQRGSSSGLIEPTSAAFSEALSCNSALSSHPLPLCSAKCAGALIDSDAESRRSSSYDGRTLEAMASGSARSSLESLTAHTRSRHRPLSLGPEPGDSPVQPTLAKLQGRLGDTADLQGSNTAQPGRQHALLAADGAGDCVPASILPLQTSTATLNPGVALSLRVDDANSDAVSVELLVRSPGSTAPGSSRASRLRQSDVDGEFAMHAGRCFHASPMKPQATAFGSPSAALSSHASTRVTPTLTPARSSEADASECQSMSPSASSLMSKRQVVPIISMPRGILSDSASGTDHFVAPPRAATRSPGDVVVVGDITPRDEESPAPVQLANRTSSLTTINESDPSDPDYEPSWDGSESSSCSESLCSEASLEEGEQQQPNGEPNTFASPFSDPSQLDGFSGSVSLDCEAIGVATGESAHAAAARSPPSSPDPSSPVNLAFEPVDASAVRMARLLAEGKFSPAVARDARTSRFQFAGPFTPEKSSSPVINDRRHHAGPPAVMVDGQMVGRMDSSHGMRRSTPLRYTTEGIGSRVDEEVRAQKELWSSFRRLRRSCHLDTPQPALSPMSLGTPSGVPMEGDTTPMTSQMVAAVNAVMEQMQDEDFSNEPSAIAKSCQEWMRRNGFPSIQVQTSAYSALTELWSQAQRASDLNQQLDRCKQMELENAKLQSQEHAHAYKELMEENDRLREELAQCNHRITQLTADLDESATDQTAHADDPSTRAPAVHSAVLSAAGAMSLLDVDASVQLGHSLLFTRPTSALSQEAVEQSSQQVLHALASMLPEFQGVVMAACERAHMQLNLDTRFAVTQDLCSCLQDVAARPECAASATVKQLACALSSDVEHWWGSIVELLGKLDDIVDQIQELAVANSSPNADGSCDIGGASGRRNEQRDDMQGEKVCVLATLRRHLRSVVKLLDDWLPVLHSTIAGLAPDMQEVVDALMKSAGSIDDAAAQLSAAEAKAASATAGATKAPGTVTVQELEAMTLALQQASRPAAGDISAGQRTSLLWTQDGVSSHLTCLAMQLNSFIQKLESGPRVKLDGDDAVHRNAASHAASEQGSASRHSSLLVQRESMAAQQLAQPRSPDTAVTAAPGEALSARSVPSTMHTFGTASVACTAGSDAPDTTISSVAPSASDAISAPTAADAEHGKPASLAAECVTPRLNKDAGLSTMSAMTLTPGSAACAIGKGAVPLRYRDETPKAAFRTMDNILFSPEPGSALRRAEDARVCASHPLDSASLLAKRAIREQGSKALLSSVSKSVTRIPRPPHVLAKSTTPPAEAKSASSSQPMCQVVECGVQADPDDLASGSRPPDKLSTKLRRRIFQMHTQRSESEDNSIRRLGHALGINVAHVLHEQCSDSDD